MQPSRRNCLWASVATVALLLISPRARADTLTITSTPPGATIEIDGMKTGVTPYKTDCPGGYFHKTHTVFSARLEHAMILKISLEGYQPQQLTLTEGPYEWIAVTGRHRGNYFLLRKSQFHIELQRADLAALPGAEPGEHAGPLQSASVVAFCADDKASDPPLGTVKIDSDPPGAEIWVDYSFAGQTPSTLRLAAGSHRIELRSPGKQVWQRNLEVSKDSQVTLHPSLESSP